MFCRNRKCQAEIQDDAAFCPYCGHRQDPKPRKASRRPNGTGSVYYMGSGRKRPWRVIKNGITVGYEATKADALKHLERLTEKDITDKYNMTFLEVYKEWSVEKFPELSKKGIDGYVNAYNHFSPLHSRRFRELRAKDYQPFIDELIALGRSSSMANKLKQLIGQMSKWAIREDIVTTNYAPFIKIPETTKREKAVFTDKEIEKLQKDGSDASKIVLMLIYTGVRIGELFNAKLEDYHESYFIGGSKTEAGKNRCIPIGSTAAPYFKYFADKASILLLDGYEGNITSDNFRKRDYAELMKRLGIRGKNPHCTRHTYTSRAVKNGVRPELLQRILGHASYTTTVDFYTHPEAQELLDATNKVF